MLVVEHDEQMMRSADWIVDMGPGAGEHGGDVVAEGAAEEIAATSGSVTGQFLSGERADRGSPEARGRRARLVRRPRRVDAQPQGHRRRVPGRAVSWS